MSERPWHDAIEHKQIALGVALAAARQHPYPPGTRKVNPDFQDVQFLKTIAVGLLANADVYCWSRDPARACYLAARSLQRSTPLTIDLVPDQNAAGFWYFHDPPPFARAAWPATDEPAPWAIAFGMTTEDDPTGKNPDGEIVMMLSVWSRQAGQPNLSPMVVSFWMLNETLEHAVTRICNIGNVDAKDPIAQAHVDQRLAIARELCPFFMAALAWLRSRIVVWTPGQLERHFRKRLTREHGMEQPPHDVKIVQLRRIESHHQDHEHHDVDWSCRWIVNGHWRLQPYKDGGRRLIYILPFVKGPGDKPLRIPDDTVYAVNR